MLSMSENANLNYVAEFVEITKLHKHSNADRLQIATINFQPVILWLDTKLWDRGIFIQVESVLDSWFLSYNNMYSNKELNKDKTVRWYIWKKWRVKATKLRWEYSMWLFIPIDVFENYCWDSIEWEIWYQFDTTSKWLFVKKYEIVKRESNNTKHKSEKARQSRLIHFMLHWDTYNIRSNTNVLELDKVITISYKLHGTSAVFWNTKVLRKLSFIERIAKFIWVDVNYTEYDLVYSSRKVVKNWYLDDTWWKWFYWTDIRWEMAKTLDIPKWITVYWEIVWYQSSWAWIQWDYDYWCNVWEKELYWYKVTLTLDWWFIYTLNTVESFKLLDRLWIKTPRIEYTWTVRNFCKLHNIDINSNRRELFIEKCEELYNWKDCYMCKNKVPEEWVVIRIESNDKFESYKLKSIRFLEYETKQLDES